MRVVLAPTRFAGTLTAAEAAEAMARGWSRAAPHDEMVRAPMSDGGPGFLDVLGDALLGRGHLPLAGDVLAATVSDPRGRPVPAAVLVVEHEGKRTAYVESAQAVGPELVAPADRDPAHTSSAGLGELLDLALSTRPTTIVVGVGPTATHDAGAGMLAALGGGEPGVLARGGLLLADARAEEIEALTAARERFSGVRLTLATTATLPLLGFEGASAVEATQRGATPEQAQALESAFGRWVHVVERVLPQQRDLVTRQPRRVDREPGAGAGGGLGYALLLLGARRVDGADLVADLVGLSSTVREADLVVTGEGTYDWRSLRDSAPAAVSARAMAAGIPAVVLAGLVQVGRREAMTAGISGIYAVADRSDRVRTALADPAGSLEARAARVAATWSPAPEGSA
ncbi:MAG: glycerate kinase [Lapillicoccus sp.]